MIIQEATVIAAIIAALASVTSLVLNTRLTEARDKRRILWEKEFERFFSLEEVAGQLVQNLLSYRCRTEEAKESTQEKLEYLHAASGRFLRYSDVSAALKDLHHSAGWYLAQDMKHETREEFEEARADMVKDHQKLIEASDRVLRRKPWWQRPF